MSFRFLEAGLCRLFNVTPGSNIIFYCYKQWSYQKYEACDLGTNVQCFGHQLHLQKKGFIKNTKLITIWELLLNALVVVSQFIKNHLRKISTICSCLHLTGNTPRINRLVHYNHLAPTFRSRQ